MPIISDLRKKYETDDVAETFQKSHDGCIGRYWTNAASTLLLFFSWTLSSWLQLQKLKPGLVAVLILRWHMKPLYTVTPYSVYIYIQIHKTYLYTTFQFRSTHLLLHKLQKRQTSHCILYIPICSGLCCFVCLSPHQKGCESNLRPRDQEMPRRKRERTSMCEQTCHIGAPFKSKKPHRLHTCCSTPAQRQLVSLHHNRLPCLDLFGLSTSGDLGIKHWVLKLPKEMTAVISRLLHLGNHRGKPSVCSHAQAIA